MSDEIKAQQKYHCPSCARIFGIFVRTVWLRHALSGSVHFVTLIPIPQPTA